MIIPAEHLKTIERTGLGKHAFSRLRYDTVTGEDNEDFVLNQDMYRGSSILLAEDNFGCGSSREHAPWALLDLGIQCIVSTSFADIFFNNCFKNGILPISVSQEELDALMAAADQGVEVHVDLKAKKIQYLDSSISFDVEEFRRHCLMNGLDDIALTLQKVKEIDRFEETMTKTKPWL
jgi:3-isopropylmalate/(R)-2-methylmalate dehydratase small subunit